MTRTDFPGDDLIPDAPGVLDRTTVFDVPAAEVWPWLQQLGKGRAGWYAPRRVERLLPRKALRYVDPSLTLAVGQAVADYGPSDFVVELLDPPHVLVYSGSHRASRYTWALLLTDLPDGRCRLHLRFRISRAGWFLRTLGDQFDHVTVAMLFAGLRERVS
jgi:hypothetical protein